MTDEKRFTYKEMSNSTNHAFKCGIQHAIFICDAYKESYPKVDLSELKEILKKEIQFADLE